MTRGELWLREVVFGGNADEVGLVMEAVREMKSRDPPGTSKKDFEGHPRYLPIPPRVPPGPRPYLGLGAGERAEPSERTHRTRRSAGGHCDPGANTGGARVGVAHTTVESRPFSELTPRFTSNSPRSSSPKSAPLHALLFTPSSGVGARAVRMGSGFGVAVEMVTPDLVDALKRGEVRVFLRAGSRALSSRCTVAILCFFLGALNAEMIAIAWKHS
mgnify:CR=1 FL=1